MDRAPIARVIERALAARMPRRVHFFSNTTVPVNPEKGMIPSARHTLALVVAGRKDVEFQARDDRRHMTAKAGDALFTCPHVWRRHLRNHSSVRLGVLFMRDITRFVAVHVGRHELNSAFHSAREVAAAGRHVLRALHALATTDPGNAAAPELCRGLLEIARTELLRQPEQLERKAERTYRALREYLDRNFHLPVNRDLVATEFGMNPSYVSELFTREGDESFTKVLTGLRMDRAVCLLREPDITVNEIAVRCGFEDPGYFNRVFRKRFGMSPGRYREATGPRSKIQ